MEVVVIDSDGNIDVTNEDVEVVSVQGGGIVSSNNPPLIVVLV